MSHWKGDWEAERRLTLAQTIQRRAQGKLGTAEEEIAEVRAKPDPNPNPKPNPNPNPNTYPNPKAKPTQVQHGLGGLLPRELRAAQLGRRSTCLGREHMALRSEHRPTLSADRPTADR